MKKIILLILLISSTATFAEPGRPGSTDHNLGTRTVKVTYQSGQVENYRVNYKSNISLSLSNRGGGCNYHISNTASRRITFVSAGGQDIGSGVNAQIYSDKSFSGRKGGKRCQGKGGAYSEWIGGYDRAHENLKLRHANILSGDITPLVRYFLKPNVTQIVVDGKKQSLNI